MGNWNHYSYCPLYYLVSRIKSCLYNAKAVGRISSDFMPQAEEFLDVLIAKRNLKSRRVKDALLKPEK